MSKQRRRYTKEFKTEAIQLVQSQGGNASSVARNLGIDQNTLNRWIREYKADKDNAFPGLGNLNDADALLRKAEKALSDVTMERDILKKALAIFSRPSH